MVLVILHELGHFWAAKKSGVKVKEFGIWMPPKICTLWTDRSGTDYTLNWIPLGGFVSLKGEDGSDPNEADAPDAFQNAKLYKKLIIILAGVAMNILVAFLIFTTLFTIGIKPISILPERIHGIYPQSYLTPSMSFLEQEWLVKGKLEDGPAVIENILVGGIADQLQLPLGAEIREIDGQAVSSMTLASTLQSLNPDHSHQLLFSHEEEKKSLTFDCQESCMLGVVLTQYGDLEVLPIQFPLPQAMLAALKEIKWERNMTMGALANIGKKLFSFNAQSSKEALEQLTGPVGAVKFGEKLLDTYGFLIFLGFGGMLSLALAFFNILPIPALDGGRFWMVLIQHLFRIKKEKFALIDGWINTLFFWFLMLVGLVILLKDLVVWRGFRLPF